jgi:hypothetical protein
MIVLNAITDNIQIVLAGAKTTNDMQCLSFYKDVTTSEYTPGRTAINSNGVTDVNIVPAPASSTQRVVDFISVYNSDTANGTVTIKLDANATETILFKAIIGTGEKIEYTNDKGFQVLTNNGSVKQSQQLNSNNPSSNAMTTVVLTGDVANANAVANTIANVTGLAFDVVAGNTYYFYFYVQFTSAAATTGSRWTINGPATPTILNYKSYYTLTATTETLNYATAYQIPAASNASALAAGNIAEVSGIIKPSSNGTVQLQFASEVLNSAITAKAGSFVQYQQIA